jgi:hypothetical protein
MTRKEQFNAEEWDRLAQGPPLAAMLVITASRGGTMRETLSVGEVYAEARENREAPELIQELLGSPPRVTPGKAESAEELRAQTTERLREAVTLIDERGTKEEADAYKKFVLEVCQRAALRHKEGGVLGIGGKRVSDAEAAALAEIAAVLDIPYPPPEESGG